MNTCTVICRSEHGAFLELGLWRDNRGEWTRGPNYRNVTLNGGVTEGVDLDFMQDWLRANRDKGYVMAGDIRVVEIDYGDGTKAIPEIRI